MLRKRRSNSKMGRSYNRPSLTYPDGPLYDFHHLKMIIVHVQITRNFHNIKWHYSSPEWMSKRSTKRKFSPSEGLGTCREGSISLHLFSVQRPPSMLPWDQPATQTWLLASCTRGAGRSTCLRRQLYSHVYESGGWKASVYTRKKWFKEWCKLYGYVLISYLIWNCNSKT